MINPDDRTTVATPSGQPYASEPSAFRTGRLRRSTGLLLAAALVCVSCRPSDTEQPAGGPQDESASASTESPQDATSEQGQDNGRNESSEPAELTRTPDLLSSEQVAEGWLCLFDGQTMFGWKANSNANWRVEGDALRAGGGEAGLLVTTTRWADYELQLEYWLEEGGNSGIFLRTSFDPQDPATDCYELNLCDSHPEYPTGSIVGRQKADVDISAEGEWKSLRVRVEGNRIEAEFEGGQRIEFVDESGEPVEIGYIGLQRNEGDVAFRNVFLHPLGMEPIFDGESLDGWREVPGSKSNFEVVDGAIHVTDGRGFLETEPTWADFVLQAEVRTNGTALNSGIFFRALPGAEEAPSHGYELQIQNGVKEGDRTQPADFGTGAIFRRQPARWVVSDDREWFTMTLVADGDHFTTWVDGVQVVDWSDDREPSDNPREGEKLEAGHISLQGHDPTTDLDFRNLWIFELPERE